MISEDEKKKLINLYRDSITQYNKLVKDCIDGKIKSNDANFNYYNGISAGLKIAMTTLGIRK